MLNIGTDEGHCFQMTNFHAEPKPGTDDADNCPHLIPDEQS